MRSKDIEDVLAMYTQYPLFIDPEGHSFNTPESLRKLYEQVFATYDSDIHLQRTGLRDAGRVYSDPDPASPPTNSQIETGTYTEDLRTRDTGTVMHVCGGYTFTWQYVNRSHWLISRMEWTSTSCPAPPVK